MKRMMAGFGACAMVGLIAWRLASAEGRVDADERVAALLPPPERSAVWEPGEGFQAMSFGGQAAIGVAVFVLGLSGMRRRR